MAPPDKPPPLPLAPDRAGLSNRISLLIASQSSVLKSMNLKPSAARRKATSTQSSSHNASDDEDLFRGATGSRPNEGVGYVPDKAQSSKDALSKEDKMLRGRILGKRGAEGAKDGKRKVVVEEEEDEDPGRSSLGKRKRARRTVDEKTVLDGESGAPATRGEEEEDEGMGEVSKELPDEETISTSQNSKLDTTTNSAATEHTDKQKKRKKKKKKDKKGRQSEDNS